MGPVVLNYELPSISRRQTRAEIMKAGAPSVLGNDSAAEQEALPGQWTLVEEINMESREPHKVSSSLENVPT